MEIGLGLGSNLGDRLAALQEAVRRIAALEGVSLRAVSPLYETAPVGARPEHAHRDYLNAVVIIEYGGDLARLAAQLHGIEAALGRQRDPADRNAPRTLDIDVLYAGQTSRTDPALTLPHPRWTERRFVVQPLADVRPDLRLPGATLTVAETLAALPPGERVVRVTERWWE